MDYTKQEFSEKYSQLIEKFSSVDIKDIKDTAVNPETPTIDDIVRTEQMAQDFLELDDFSRQEVLPFFVYQLYVDTQSIFKYFTSKDIEVDENTYQEFVADHEAGRTLLSHMVNKLFAVYDVVSKNLNKEIEVFHKDEKSGLRHLEHVKRKMHKMFYKGKRPQSSTGTIRDISKIFEANHGGFYAASKAFNLACDQFVSRSNSLSIKKSHSPGTLKERMKDVIAAIDKVERSYSETDDPDCKIRYEEIRPKIDLDLDKMTDIYSHALKTAKEDLSGDKDLLGVAYDDPFDNVNDIDGITDNLFKRWDNLRIIAGYLDQDRQEIDSVLEDVGKDVDIAKALKRYSNDYIELRSKMLQFNADIELNEEDLSKVAHPEKNIRELNEEISRIERALPEHIRDKAMAKPYANITHIMDIFINDIDHIVYNELNFKDFELKDLRAFKADLEELGRSYERLERQQKGPVRISLGQSTKITDIFSSYKQFVNVCSSLKIERETYVKSDLERYEYNLRELKEFHLNILRKAQGLPGNHTDIISREIDDQIAEFENRIRDNSEKTLENLANTANDQRVSLEQRIDEVKKGLELIAPVIRGDILTKDHKDLYDNILSLATALEEKRDSIRYRLGKFIDNFKRKETIKVKERKDLLLDTSTIVHDPACIGNFEENKVYIPMEVIEEINSLKDRPNKPHIQKNVSAAIDNLLRWGVTNFSLDSGLKHGARINDKGGILYVLDNIEGITTGLDSDVIDNRIIEQAIKLKKKGINPEIVSNDKLMRFKSLYKGIFSRPYITDIVEPDLLNKGYREIQVDERIIETFIKTGRIDMELDNLVNNEVIVMLDKSNPTKIAYARFNNGIYHQVNPDVSLLGSIGALNTEQVAVIEGLLCPDIELLAIEGPAGTGKSLLTLAGGIEQKYNEIYNQVLVYRAFVDVGRGVGYLKGSLDEKVSPWFSYVWDALDSIARLSQNNPDDSEVETMIEQYMRSISINPLFNIRGTSKTRKFMVGAEWQNTTPHESKTFISRAGEGTKVVLEGDFSQIDEPRFLSQSNNGLNRAIKSFNGQDNFMGIRLVQRSSRSRLADQANTLM